MHTINLRHCLPASKQDTPLLLPTWKRATDLLFCLLALPVLVMLTVVMTVLTKLVSPGPVLFRQERVGWMGRRIWTYQFRTMHVCTDRECQQCQGKILPNLPSPAKQDRAKKSRHIPGSWILRASGFDELPQLINVFRGEMSVVGPRPGLPAEYATGQPGQRKRGEAMPGLIGSWRISGKLTGSIHRPANNAKERE